MFKKQLSIIMALMMIFSLGITGFAESKNPSDMVYSTESGYTKGEKAKELDNMTARKGGKVIIVDMARTNISNFEKIKYLKKMMDRNGEIGLVNIRGDKGYDDVRNYASIGATGRADIQEGTGMDFRNKNKDNAEVYRAATGLKAEGVNLYTINSLDLFNQSKGEYKSKMGYLGETLEQNGKKVAVLGNADYYDIMNSKYVRNRAFCLSVMDTKGRIGMGDVDNINSENLNYPFGISTDYDRLLKQTEDYYSKADLLFVELGDTYRLDLYKENLNNVTYAKMKKAIYRDISSYLEAVFKMAGKNDTIYVMGGFPSNIDYKNNRRLGALVRFDMSGSNKGILYSRTTRRDGILANMDIGVDILNRFGLANPEMVGRSFRYVKNDNPMEFINREYKKVVAISSIRMDIINIYVAFISISWAVAAIALWKRNRISSKYREKVLKILKELVKFGLIMPLAFLSAPVFGSGSELVIALSIIGLSIFYYLLARIIFRNDDIKQIGLYSLVMIAIITVDSILSTPLMESNIMSYDPMIGARYYGIGNEYEGVTIGSAILGFAVLLEYKKIPKWLTSLLLVFILFTSAYPAMGANVGGAISECMAYITFILMIYDIKIDLKKAVIIVLSAAVLVALFAVADITLGMGSHLGNFVEQIKLNGPMEVVYVFGRKIAMNVELAQTTVWVNILLVGLVILTVGVFRPNRGFKSITEYRYIHKGFIATLVGCFVTLLVNDSGIIAAATDSIYLLIPILIMMINKKNSEDMKVNVKR